MRLKLVDFESQLLKSKLLSPNRNFNKDSEEVQTTMEKHHQLKTDIQLLTEEWEKKLTLEAERVNGALAEVQEKG